MAYLGERERSGLQSIAELEARVQLCTDALEANPDDITNYINRSQAHLELAQFTECLCDTDKALALDPDNVTVLTTKGISLYELNKLDDSMAALNTAKTKVTENTSDTRLDDWHEKCSIAIEKRDASNLLTATPPPPTIKYDWYQTNSNIVITILIKKLPTENFKLNVTDTTLEMELLVPGETEPWTQHLNLTHEINSAKTSFKVLSTKVEVKLYKTEAVRWNALEAGSELDKLKTFTSAAAAPTAIGNTKWDKLAVEVAEEEKNENLEGDAALQKLFRDIYSGGSEETRRAMNKSFQQSGGTVLSTNWGDIGKKDVDVKPPDGMEYKKWD